MSPLLNSSIETKYFDNFAEGECRIQLSNTQACASLLAADGSQLVDCDEAVFAARPYNKKHYLVGFQAKCQEGPESLTLYTEALKYNDIIGKLAPKACWKPYY
ncbi:uncharacterized protein LOC112539044 [Tetranychus urticae]|uniref:Uncharacterized protein n=1 Tax=Tetranychus urticae TaxID=32264 RepID=T1KH80_TETUR|nr:uncharacterized protein LOC112539044 [Tetranychus urticae]